MASFFTILILLFWQYALEFFSDKSQKADDGDDSGVNGSGSGSGSGSDSKSKSGIDNGNDNGNGNGNGNGGRHLRTESHRQQPTAPSRRSTILSDHDDNSTEYDDAWELFASSAASIRSSTSRANERRLAFEREIVDLHSSLCSTRDELDKERNAHMDTERELREKASECNELRNHWKSASTQLTQTRNDGQAYPQINDDVLIQATQRLRFKIHSFAVQYFGDEVTFNPRLEVSEVAPFDKYTWSTKSWKKIQTSYLKSTARRPILVQAYLWRSMVSNVFGCFLWAAGCHWSVWNLYTFLYPESTEVADLEAERKVSLWRAVTTRLLLDKMGQKGGTKDAEVTDSFKTFLQLKIMKDLRVLIKGPVDDCLQDLMHLIDEAVTLDKLMSQQAANIFWDFGDETWSAFDPATMAMAGGEKPPQGNQEVLMAVAPAMMKQGRDSGEDFHLISKLMSPQVSCASKRKLAFWK